MKKVVWLTSLKKLKEESLQKRRKNRIILLYKGLKDFVDGTLAKS